MNRYYFCNVRNGRMSNWTSVEFKIMWIIIWCCGLTSVIKFVYLKPFCTSYNLKIEIELTYSFQLCSSVLSYRYVLAKMEEESEEDPHGHITSLAVRRSHRYGADICQNIFLIFFSPVVAFKCPKIPLVLGLLAHNPLAYSHTYFLLDEDKLILFPPNSGFEPRIFQLWASCSATAPPL